MWWMSLGLAGSIEGTITDAAGAPIAGANVVAYDRRFRFSNIGSDAQGRYLLDDLAPGSYRVRVIPPDGSFVQEQWDGDTVSACESPPYEVGEEGSATVDVGLPTGGVLVGQVFQRDHSPLVGEEVEVFPLWYRDVGVASRSAVTDDEGRFEVRGLPRFRTLPPDYLLEVQRGVVPEQFYRGVWLEEEAEPITALEDQTDMGGFSVRGGVSLSGTLSGPDGPISGGEIHVFAGRTNQVTITDVEGVWSLDAVEPGEVLLWATADGFGRTYWPDLDRPPEERLLVEPEGTAREDLDIVMPPEATLTGTLVTSRDPSLASILVINEDASVALATGVEEDATFAISGLNAGTWTVEVYGPELDIVEGAILDASGNPLSAELVEGQETSVGRIDPPPASRVEGLITDSVTGEPVYGAAVIAESEVDQFRRLAFTDNEGRYSLVAMPPGSWTLQASYSPFCLVDPSWVTVYWPAQVNPNVGGAVDLSPSEVFEWDASLPPDVDLDEMGDDWEEANGLDVGRNDAEEDPDGDGFTNLVEYRLGTDPRQVFEQGGCSCAGSRVALLLPGLALFARRRRYCSRGASGGGSSGTAAGPSS